MSQDHMVPLIQQKANENGGQLVSEKKYTFPLGGNNNNINESRILEVTIKEKCDTDYSMITWPAAPVLSKFMIKHRSQFAGKRILELGSGTGLCGIVGALLGAKLIVTDSHLARQKSSLLDVNILQNNLIIGTDDSIEDIDPKVIHIFPLTWGRFTGVFFKIPLIDAIIASDCFYDPNDFEDILMTLAYFMTRNPETVCYTTYQVRNSSWNIECVMKRWNLHCECVHVDYEDDDGDYDQSQGQRSRSTILIYKITREPRT
ncbi:histone-arginine methyltransferase METTL23-like [Panonychus citri]|uniref:histone-arginine methyltransferase METTL23-like n=1 Tax=Panonychus citri TaxID=50023 RepID=UPI002306EF70|nr:histone-arginine methyltransferase METTL23-like [Panonychus citri]